MQSSDNKIDSVISKLRKKIINGRLNITSAWFAMLAFVVCMIFPLVIFYFVNQSTNFVKSSLTIFSPLLVNMIIIPLFMVFSFYLEVDEKLLNDSNDTNEKKYLKDKQIVWTESILIGVSSFPIAIWYFFVGYNRLGKNHPNIAILVFLFTSLIVLVILMYYVIVYLSKIAKCVYKKIKSLSSTLVIKLKALITKLLQTFKS